MDLMSPGALAEFGPPLEKGFEWVDGQAVEKPMGAEAGVILWELYVILGGYVRANNLGFLFPAETGYEGIFASEPKKVRKPDCSFVRTGRFPDEKAPRGNVRIPPDFVAEVISPNDLAEDTGKRVAEYLQAGTELLWVIYPASRTVHVFRRDGSGAHLTSADTLAGENVIPGFSCPVAEIFARV